eukprot:392554_1
MLASCCPSKKGGELDNMNNDVHPGAVKYPSVQPSRSMGDWIIIGFMFIVVVLFLAFCIRVSTVATQSDENVPKITQKYMPAIKSNILDKPVTGVPSNGSLKPTKSEIVKTTTAIIDKSNEIPSSESNVNLGKGGSSKPTEIAGSSKPTEVKVEQPKLLSKIESELAASGYVRENYASGSHFQPEICHIIADYSVAETGPIHAEWRGTTLSLVFDNPKYLDGKDGGKYEFLADADTEDQGWYKLDVKKGEVNFYMYRSLAREWKTLTVNVVRTSEPYDRVATKTIIIPNLRESLQATIREQFKLPDLNFPPTDRGREGEEDYFRIYSNHIALTRHYCEKCELVHLDEDSEEHGDSGENNGSYFYAAHMKYSRGTNMWAWDLDERDNRKLVPQYDDEAIFAL